VNNLNWLTNLFSRRNKGIFNRGNNNRGMVWLSLLGLGIGGAVAAYGMNRGRGTNGLQNAVQSVQKGLSDGNLQNIMQKQ